MNREELLDKWVKTKTWSQWWNNDPAMKKPTWKKLKDELVNLTDKDFESLADFALSLIKQSDKRSEN